MATKKNVIDNDLASTPWNNLGGVSNNVFCADGLRVATFYNQANAQHAVECVNSAHAKDARIAELEADKKRLIELLRECCDLVEYYYAELTNCHDYGLLARIDAENRGGNE